MAKRNINMYPVEEELLNRAIESPQGIKIRFKDLTKDFSKWGIQTRHRLNQCREADRQRNQAIYSEGDPRWGKSPFDALMISISAADRAIVITHRLADLEDLEIEEIK